MNPTPWYAIANVAQLDSPALVIYPDRVEANIQRLMELIDDKARLRPHVKTHKSREATALLLAVGIQKFKCATIAEAEMLAITGAPDVLLAYQPVGAKQDRLLTLIQTYPGTGFSCLVDDLATAEALSERATQARLTVPVYVDVNVGMNRTGIAPDQDAFNLYVQLNQLPGIRPVGLHAYDGHVRNPDYALRQAECDAAFAPVTHLRGQLRARGFDPVVVAGGSPTFPIHARRPDVECSPGTFIYWDNGYGTTCSEQPFEPAALIVTRVISRPDATKLCLDLGHKSVAAEGELKQRVHFLNAPDLAILSQSEEHLVIEAGDGHGYGVGDVLYGLPQHICPTVALYERAYTVAAGRVTGEWRTVARDRMLTI